jgi:hypothetical protein
MTDRSRDPIPAIIVNSGSTNVPGLEIELYESGRTEFRVWPGRIPTTEAGEAPAAVTGTVPGELATRFFRDLAAALPFSQYPDPPGFKSASFGFVLRVRYRDEQSPDLALPLREPRLQALARDAREVEEAVRRRSAGQGGDRA